MMSQENFEFALFCLLYPVMSRNFQQIARFQIWAKTTHLINYEQEKI